MIWIAVPSGIAIAIFAVFMKFSKRKKHWQVGYRTLRPDLLPKREKKYSPSTFSESSSAPVWENSYFEPKIEEQKTEEDTVFPPGMFD